MVNEVERAVREALAGVPDPEIPVCSIADLGMIERVVVTDDEVDIGLLPTFAGCPAQFVIREEAARAAGAVAGGRAVRVRFCYDPPWTTDRVTPEGRRALASFGISPPVRHNRVPCPYCGSTDTRIESEFGPTPCRAVRYCNACRNPFERFKRKAPDITGADR